MSVAPASPQPQPPQMHTVAAWMHTVAAWMHAVAAWMHAVATWMHTVAGGFVRTIGRNGRGPGEFDRPFDVTISPDGHLLVTDYENHRVQVSGPAGGYWGVPGGWGVGAVCGWLL